MRGVQRPYRGNKKPPRVNEATTQPVTIPAPIGGWNTVDALASMNPLDAVVLNNIFPTTSGVELRGGKVGYAFLIASPVKTLLSYTSGTASSFWAGTNAGIYNITTGGDKSAVAVSIALTEGRLRWRNYRTAAGSYIVAVNGADSLVLYDGATWASITAVSAPIAITGVTTSSLTNVCNFQKRLWFVQENTLDAWYLPVDSVGGAATRFPFGAIFRKGGSIVAQESWTVDTGSGIDDYLVTITDQGEVAIYRGTDPASSATFTLVGVYQMGKPCGPDCLVQYGGELLIISKTGCTPVSSLLNSTVVDRSKQITYKIDSAFAEAGALYSGNDGWQGWLYPEKNALIFNIPTVEDTESVQYVMNTITKAWCSFSGWGASCLGIFQEQLYTARGSSVFTTWSGTDDDGTSITATVQQAYTNFRILGQKHVELIRPMITLNGPVTVYMSFLNDFTDNIDQSTIGLNVATSSAIWDTSLWDTGLWGEEGSYVQPKWLHVQNNSGFFHSFRLQIITSTATLSWVSTDYALRRMDIL